MKIMKRCHEGVFRINIYEEISKKKFLNEKKSILNKFQNIINSFLLSTFCIWIGRTRIVRLGRDRAPKKKSPN